ncbi:MAG TPA: helix-turn-helix transcriptional regulator [Streptosporangiaceae bacterium]|jgi:transcriptional regulator with XRE-family HTH domain
MGVTASRLSPAFWSEPVVASALARCDFPVLLAEISRERGWTQSELAREIGYSQSWVSRVMRGKHELTLDQVREVSVRLTIPVHLLRFGPGGDDPARRREFGQAVILAGLALPGAPEADAETAPALTAITQAQRRLEATTAARELERGVTAHAEMASRVLARTRAARREVAAAVSEAAGLAAWLHADMCDLGTARMYYRMAVDAARHAGHDLLAGYMLGSLAAFEIEAGDPVSGLGLAERARTQLSKSEHPAPHAWLGAIEAVGHATAGADGYAADKALHRAEDAAGSSQAQMPPPWPWLFPFDHAKLAGYRALVCVRLRRPGDALAAFAESLAGPRPAPKQRAMVMLEVATACCHEGMADRDTTRVDEAFRLASEAVAAGARFGSERVIQRSRQFRRGYPGPATAQIQDFDRQFKSTLW